MNRTIEDSKQSKKPEVTCTSVGKNKERGFKVIQPGKKDYFLQEIQEIKAKDGELLENGTLRTENGINIINFADYAKVKNNNESRITEFAIQKAKRKSQRDNEQVI